MEAALRALPGELRRWVRSARPGEPRAGTGGHTGRLTRRFPRSVVTAPFE